MAMSDNPRLDGLRRRVQADPASIAFAQLAEEYRRAGNYAEALARNPSATTLTAPREGKWREENATEIERIRPLVAAVERRLGYDVA